MNTQIQKGALWQTLTIPISLVAILMILLFPLPTTLLDICLALNVTISLVIMFACLYMEKPLAFSTFPALLLITTLFRLSMNVASTRLILLNGDQGLEAAGEVIKAFGEFVIGGNYMVGVIIFIVISLVNLKVITKGSGRIAEVAARFTLDAMPGKQMAIDSDLNTGLIKDAEAKVRRKELQQEAEFYGAMDGAAKFVAGDAIAGIFITWINILGGFAIGVIQKNMEWMKAAETYTILTVGDGLISQIPAIIISTASGLIVARASSGADLGVDVIGQLSSSSKPLYLTSGVCIIFGLLPGLPTLPFFVLASITGGLGYVTKNLISSKATISEGVKQIEEAEKGPKPGSTEEVTTLLGMDTLELEVGYELVRIVEGGDLVERIRSIRRQFALDYGFIVPPIHIRDNVRIKPTEYRFMLKGTPIGTGELRIRHLLAMDPGNVSQTVSGIPTKEPAFGLDALWIAESEKERAQFSGYTVVDLSTVVTTHLTELIRSNMHELLGRQDVQHLIETVQKEYPKVIEELIPNLMTVGQVQQVLVNLLREQISIRDLRSILETLCDWAGQVKHPEKLAEFVRKKLSRSITGKYLTPDGILPLASLNPVVERYLSENIQHTDEGSFLALDPRYAQQLIHKLNGAAEKFAELGQSPILLAPSHLRAALFRFVDRFANGYAVICHQEIAPSTKVQSMGVIALEEMQMING
jgi:flagellar biosynthesis protein FlhA